MAKCGTCAWFGKKNGIEWCFHKMKDWSTSSDQSACTYYESKW